jgi:hypothetical protein
MCAMPFVKSETLGCTAKSLGPSEIIAVSGGAWTQTNKAYFGAKRSRVGRQFSLMGAFACPRKKVQSRISSRLETDPLPLLSVFIDHRQVGETV